MCLQAQYMLSGERQVCDKTGKSNQLHWTTNFKKFFVSVMIMLLIYLFASMKLEKGHKKDYLALILKLC